MPTINTLHILPLQLTLRADLGVDIVCDDPLAHLDDATGILTINLPSDRRNPRRGQDGVLFVVVDLPPFDGTVHYVSMYSGPADDALGLWEHDAGASRSAGIGAPAAIVIWAVVLAIPEGEPGAAKVYNGRRNVKVDYQGGGDLTIF
jgi:hypothetical protein